MRGHGGVGYDMLHPRKKGHSPIFLLQGLNSHSAPSLPLLTICFLLQRQCNCDAQMCESNLEVRSQHCVLSLLLACSPPVVRHLFYLPVQHKLLHLILKTQIISPSIPQWFSVCFTYTPWPLQQLAKIWSSEPRFPIFYTLHIKLKAWPN